MIIFYRIPNESPNIVKISNMLKETGIPYVEKIIYNEEDEKELAAISPNGTAPAILDTDTDAALFESGAILIYLAEKTGQLIPNDENTRANVLKWLMFEAANVCPTMIELHHYILRDFGQTPESVIERYKQRLKNYCSILNEQLRNSHYLAGEYSIADIILFPWMVTLEDMAEIDITDYPYLNKWAHTINNRLEAINATQANPNHREWCYRNNEFMFCSA